MTDENVTAKHNLKNRKAIVRKAHHDLLRLEDDKAEIQVAIKAIRKTLKDDLDMKLRAFDDARRLIALEEAERSNAQDDFKLAYEALSPNETINWVTALGEQDAA